MPPPTAGDGAPTTSYVFDLSGQLITMTDPAGSRTTYEYDAAGRLRKETNAQGQVREHRYDSLGNEIETIDRNGRVTKRTFDAMDRLISERWFADALDTVADEQISWTYDQLGRLKGASNLAASYAYSYIYDDLDRVTFADMTIDDVRLPIFYEFDNAGDLKKRQDQKGPVGGAVVIEEANFTYDNLHRLKTIARANSFSFDQLAASFDFLLTGELDSMSRWSNANPSVVIASDWNYDDAGRVTDIKHTRGATVFADYDIVYDAAGRVTGFTHSDDGSAVLDYDDNGQLVDAVYANFDDLAFDYDLNGNRVEVERNGSASVYSVGQDNEITGDGTFTYEHDDEGNLVRKVGASQVFEYSWDHRNRLTKIVTRDAATQQITQQATYAYDAFDRRITKRVDGPMGGALELHERYVHDGDELVTEVDGSGNVKATYMHGALVDQVLAEDVLGTGNVNWLLGDHQESVRDVVSVAGAKTQHAAYDPFGNVLALSSGTALATRFGFTGQELDAESGLYHYSARYYDSTTGRFISTDPAGFEAGDTNLYRYVNNSPLEYVDPTGLALLRPVQTVANVVTSVATSAWGSITQNAAWESSVVLPHNTLSYYAAPQSALTPLSTPSGNFMLDTQNVFLGLRAQQANVQAGLAPFIPASNTMMVPTADGRSLPVRHDHILSDYAAMNRRQPDSPWNDMSTLGSALGMVGGGLEVAGGVSIAMAGGPAGWVAGGAMIAHGLDLAGTSGYNLATGSQRDTFAMQGMQSAGMSRESAQWVDTGIGFLNGGVGLMRGASRTIQAGISRVAPARATAPQAVRGGTYVLRDPATGQVMRSGRTNDLLRREAEHLRDPALRDYRFEAVHKTDVYEEQRGLEQLLHEMHTPQLNRIGGIHPTNPRLPDYLEEARRFLEHQQGGS